MLNEGSAIAISLRFDLARDCILEPRFRGFQTPDRPPLLLARGAVFRAYGVTLMLGK